MEFNKIIDENNKLKREIKRLNDLLKQHGITDYNNKAFTTEEKMIIFKDYFRGREERYAFYFKGGYHPACYNRNKGICYIVKKSKKCSICNNANFIPLSDDIIRSHISKPNHKIGIYPLMLDNTCYFVAIDFDEDDWFEAMLSTFRVAKRYGIDSVMERSTSGKGGHLWFFFNEKVYASKARRMALLFLNEAMKINRRINFASFDRLFPNQDFMPEGKFGNLIALPFEYNAIQNQNTMFINENGEVIKKQFQYLTTITKISTEKLNSIVDNQNVETIFNSDDSEDSFIKKNFQITITEDSRLHIYKLNLPSSIIRSIRKLATIWNNQYFLFQNMRKPIFSTTTPMTLSEYEETDTHIIIPRGIKQSIFELFVEHINIKDKTISGNNIEVSFKGNLRPYQEKAVKQALESEMGIIVAPTGAGKTVMAISMISHIHKNTLIIMENKQLLKQWNHSIDTFLEYPKAKLKKDHYIGEFSGSKKRLTGNIDIALIKSLANIEDTSIYDQYGLVIIDECHHIASNTYRQVLRQIKAKKIYAFTATPRRADGQDKIVNMYIGNEITRVHKKDIESYRNYKQLLIPRFTTFSLLDDTVNFTAIINLLIKNQKRNNLIINDIIKEFRSNKNCIILSDRIEHLQILYNVLKEVSEMVFILTGKTKSKEKDKIITDLKNVENKKYILLASSKLLGEGFDLPNLETMFLATPISWQGRTTQYTGRLHRKEASKDIVKVYDYIDSNIDVLNKMYRKRLRVYKKEGYEIEINQQTIEVAQHLYDDDEYQNQIYLDMQASQQEILICCDKLLINSIKRKYKQIEKHIYSGIEIYVFILENGIYDQECIKYLKGLGVKIQFTTQRSKCIIIDKRVIWIPSMSYFDSNSKKNSACRLMSVDDVEEIYLDIRRNIINK